MTAQEIKDALDKLEKEQDTRVIYKHKGQEREGFFMGSYPTFSTRLIIQDDETGDYHSKGKAQVRVQTTEPTLTLGQRKSIRQITERGAITLEWNKGHGKGELQSC